MLIDKKLLDEVLGKASECPRLRMNFNFHESGESKSQRLLNALLPGTKLAIHRHTFTSETYILITGSLRIIFYDDNHQVTATFLLDREQGNYGINIPIGQWHNFEVIAPGTVIFECKDGPYTPLTPENIME